MPKDTHIVEQYLDTSEEGGDTSLRGNAMRRALGPEVPRTLTPYEWEEWYSQHGVPDAHHKAVKPSAGRWSSWKSWFGLEREV